jgi:C-terminal region of MMR_HSR1 domain
MISRCLRHKSAVGSFVASAPHHLPELPGLRRAPRCPLCPLAAVKAVCSEYRVHNADIHMRDDCDIDDLVDVIEGSRIYIPCVYAVNKIDQVCGWVGLSACVCPSVDLAELGRRACQNPAKGAVWQRIWHAE